MLSHSIPLRTRPKACRTCALVKAKCIWDYEERGSSSKCKRCNRLDKECRLQTPARRERKTLRKTRISQLEEKIDTLSSMLQNSHPMSQETTTKHKRNVQAPLLWGDYAPIKNHEQLLDFFRAEILAQFPFVVVPPGSSADKLAEAHPFLYKCVLVVGSYRDVVAQTARATEAMEYLAQHIIIKAERSLDLLQGLLIFIGWFHFSVHTGRRLNALVALAVAMVIDLGLDGEPTTADMINSPKWALKGWQDSIPSSAARTLDERRAFLGVQYLTSALSVYFQGLEPLKFSHYAKSCVQVLSTDPARTPSDEYLIQLVRLQSIAQEMSEARIDPGVSSPESLMYEAAPLAMIVKTLQKKLERFCAELPPSYKSNPILLMHYHSILIYLTEIGLSVPLLSRQATLHVCLSSTHSFLAAFFSIPLYDSFKITYISWIHLLYILPVLSKLSEFECDDWDPSHVRGVVDLSLVLGSLIGHFEKARELHDKRRRLLHSNLSEGVVGSTSRPSPGETSGAGSSRPSPGTSESCPIPDTNGNAEVMPGSDTSTSQPDATDPSIYVKIIERFKTFRDAFAAKRDELEAARSLASQRSACGTSSLFVNNSERSTWGSSAAPTHTPIPASTAYPAGGGVTSSSSSAAATSPAMGPVVHQAVASHSPSSFPSMSPPAQTQYQQSNNQGDYVEGNDVAITGMQYDRWNVGNGKIDETVQSYGSDGNEDADGNQEKSSLSQDTIMMNNNVLTFDRAYDTFWEEMMQDFPAFSTQGSAGYVQPQRHMPPHLLQQQLQLQQMKDESGQFPGHNGSNGQRKDAPLAPPMSTFIAIPGGGHAYSPGYLDVDMAPTTSPPTS